MARGHLLVRSYTCHTHQPGRQADSSPDTILGGTDNHEVPQPVLTQTTKTVRMIS
jgi:hypothetical protein